MMRDAVVIVGAGLMGGGIAARSALAGNKTVVVDTDSARAAAGVGRAVACMDELAQNDLFDADTAAAAKQLLSAADHLDEALAGARMVIEAIVEDLAQKQALFRRLDAALPPEVPILSNTSGLRITDIAAGMARPERAVTAHFWFPAHLVPLVEVVVGDKTDPQLAQAVKEELDSWGKKAILVKRDLPGQLANRVLQAIIREAANIVEIGLASAEDVDTAIKAGLGIRLPVWGPLEHVDAVGLDLCVNVQDTVLPGISDRRECGPLMREMKAEGNLGYKTGSGFYDWSQKDMGELEKKRNDFIIHALRQIT